MKPIIVGGAEALKVAAFLKQHDVPVLIMGVRNLPRLEDDAPDVNYSMPGKTDALKSVTIWPAQIFGMGDKLGSLEVGKLANVVMTTGDILEGRTDTKYLFIDGRPVPLDPRHTELYMQFKDRP